MSTPDSIPGAYWPAGWSKDFLLPATSADLLALPDEERDRMFDSLRSALGTSGFSELMTEASRNHKARVAQEDAARVAAGGEKIPTVDELRKTDVPLYMKALQQYYAEDQAWGFVVVRTCCHDDGERWSQFKAKWDAVIAAMFDRASTVDGIADVNRRFTVHWVEDPQLEGASPQQMKSSTRYHPGGSSVLAGNVLSSQRGIAAVILRLQTSYSNSMDLGNNHPLRPRRSSDHPKY